jgi:hypothetical protein
MPGQGGKKYCADGAVALPVSTRWNHAFGFVTFNKLQQRASTPFVSLYGANIQYESDDLMMCGQETRKSEIKNADAKCEYNDTSLITAAIILVIFIILSA